MNKQNFILTLILISFTSIIFGQKREKIPDSEIREIIQLAIDLPELQQYYLQNIDTTGTPITIKEFGAVNSNNLKGLVKFGQKVEVFNDTILNERNIKNYLNIGDWTYGGDNLRLQMDYPIARILINMRLNRINGQWEIVNSKIFEE